MWVKWHFQTLPLSKDCFCTLKLSIDKNIRGRINSPSFIVKRYTVTKLYNIIMKNEFAFILGNGKTRKEFLIKDLLRKGKVFACNRVYQESPSPHTLVSVDKDMAHEIQNSGYSAKNTHYTRESNVIKNSGALGLHKKYFGYSSGPNCVALAANEGFPYIFFIGMDLHSLDPNYINNLYAGEKFYKQKTDIPQIFNNWVKQIQDIAKEFSNQRFIHINPLLGFTPTEWTILLNFSIMTSKEFRIMINN